MRAWTLELGELLLHGADIMTAEQIKRVLQSHFVQCTGPGEVSCGHEECDGWMSWGAFYQHQANAIIATAEQEPTS